MRYELIMLEKLTFSSIILNDV